VVELRSLMEVTRVMGGERMDSGRGGHVVVCLGGWPCSNPLPRHPIRGIYYRMCKLFIIFIYKYLQKNFFIFKKSFCIVKAFWVVFL
jgi:hypothetical protein